MFSQVMQVKISSVLSVLLLLLLLLFFTLGRNNPEKVQKLNEK